MTSKRKAGMLLGVFVSLATALATGQSSATMLKLISKLPINISRSAFGWISSPASGWIFLSATFIVGAVSSFGFIRYFKASSTSAGGSEHAGAELQKPRKETMIKETGDTGMSQAVIFCTTCGAKLATNSKFCKRCGSPVT